MTKYEYDPTHSEMLFLFSHKSLYLYYEVSQ